MATATTLPGTATGPLPTIHTFTVGPSAAGLAGVVPDATGEEAPVTSAKPPKTYVGMVVDESGSMARLADDVRGGFNTYLDSLRQTSGVRFRVTVTKFDTTVKTLCTAAKLKDVPRLDESNYLPGGGTALLDAIGETIANLDAALHGRPDSERALVVVQTDGQENSSREYRLDDIRKLITEREATGRWQFLFIGAGLDTWQQAEQMGFAGHNTVGTYSTTDGVGATYSGLAAASVAYASGLDNEGTAKTLRTAMGDQAHH